MSIWLSALLDIIPVGLEVVIYLLLPDAFFARRTKGWHFALTAIGFFVLIYIAAQVCTIFALKELVELLLITALCISCYRAKVISALFLSLFSLAFMNVAEILVIYGLTALTGQGLSDLADQPFLYCLLVYSVKLFELLVVAIIRVWLLAHFTRRQQKLGNYLRFGIFPLASFISVVLMYVAAAQAPQIAPYLFFCLILLLAADIASILLMTLFDQQEQASTENNILHRQLDTAMDSISAAAKSYENERRLTHEFQNQIIVIRGMIEDHANQDQITAYLDQMSHATTTGSLAISTNRPAADALLNQKYLIADQKGIVFTVRLDDLSAFPLPDNALVVLLSNLIDNAMEACEKDSAHKERKIIIKISVSDNDCILSVENTVTAAVEIHDNMVATTKPNPERHGFGMKNIAAIVESYDGYYTLHCDDRIFQFVAVFPGPQKEKL